jgi:hypothetical protein
MTLEGYFLYVVKKKLLKANSRVEVIQSADGLDVFSDSAIEQRVLMWFWGSLIATAASAYCELFFDVKNFDVRDIDVQSLTIEQLKHRALIFITANKILTGALGYLSERNQLALQEIAWHKQSTAAIIDDGGAKYQELLRSRNINIKWAEYHSSLKDLTGLWFKAALIDVMDKENLGIDFYERLLVVLRWNAGRCWGLALERAVRLMKDEKWDALWDKREGYSDELEVLPWRELWTAIVEVETVLANYLEQDFIPKLRQRKEQQERTPQAPLTPIFQLPQRSERVFLHFPYTMPWEGRYDTMIESIPYPDQYRPWTYLIEHRFN